jgi:hypothetical protein
MKFHIQYLEILVNKIMGYIRVWLDMLGEKFNISEKSNTEKTLCFPSFEHVQGTNERIY